MEIPSAGKMTVGTKKLTAAVVEAARNIDKTGDKTEQRLFCFGSINAKPRGPWRQYFFIKPK